MLNTFTEAYRVKVPHEGSVVADDQSARFFRYVLHAVLAHTFTVPSKVKPAHVAVLLHSASASDVVKLSGPATSLPLAMAPE